MVFFFALNFSCYVYITFLRYYFCSLSMLNTFLLLHIYKLMLYLLVRCTTGFNCCDLILL